MSYPATIGRRMGYHNDGTIVCQWDTYSIKRWCTPDELAELNDFDYVGVLGNVYTALRECGPMFWFPEKRWVTGYYGFNNADNHNDMNSTMYRLDGSNDTTNGLDGTWEAASLPDGIAPSNANYFYSSDSWRTSLKRVVFTEPKQVVRVVSYGGYYGLEGPCCILHLWGYKGDGETPDDIIFIDNQGGGGEWVNDPDWGDVIAGTTVKKQFQIRNTSASRTATTIGLTCSDTDFSISSDDVTYGSSLSLSSLGPGATSDIYYVKCTVAALGIVIPQARHANVVVTVGSWT